jgi:PASTA domain
LRVALGEDQYLEPVSPTEVQVSYAGHSPAFIINAEKAHDADGASVPTTLEETGRDIVTLTVHYRAGNPAAGGAPFEYPITAGEGWEGGFQTVIVQMSNPNGEPAVSLTDEPSPLIPAARCTVPRLRGLDLRAAKARLRAAHCGIGEVHLDAGATAGKGKVVKQFRAVGLKLAAGAPVAVKLGAGASG